MRSFCLGLVLSAVALFCGGCVAEEDSSFSTLLVGLVDVSEGKFAHFNDSLSVNTRLALAGHSEHGIIAKKNGSVRVQFLTMPMTDRLDAPRQTLFEAVNTYGAGVIIGGARSQTAIRMAGAAEVLRIPFLSTSATSSLVTSGKQYTFATCPSKDILADNYALFLRHSLRAGRIAVMVEIDARDAEDFAYLLTSAFTASGGTVTVVHFFTGLDDLSAGLVDIVNSNPDAIVVCSVEPHVFIPGRKLEALGYHNPLLGTHSRQAHFFAEHLPQPKLPVFYLSYWNPNAPSALSPKYVRDFHALTGKYPTEDDALAYDAMLRLIAAVRDAPDVSPEALRKALEEQESMEGVIGSYRFKPRTQLGRVWSVAILDGRLRIEEIHLPEAVPPADASAP